MSEKVREKVRYIERNKILRERERERGLRERERERENDRERIS